MWTITTGAHQEHLQRSDSWVQGPGCCAPLNDAVMRERSGEVCLILIISCLMWLSATSAFWSISMFFCFFFKSKPNWKLVELIMFNHVSSRKKTWISIDQQHLSLSKWAFAFTELVRHIIHTDANTVMICYLSMWNIHHNDESQMKVNAELWSLVNDRAQTTIGWNPEPHSGGRPVLGCTANIKCVFIWPRPSVAGLGFGSASWGLYQITLWKVSLIFW